MQEKPRFSDLVVFQFYSTRISAKSYWANVPDRIAFVFVMASVYALIFIFYWCLLFGRPLFYILAGLFGRAIFVSSCAPFVSPKCYRWARCILLERGLVKCCLLYRSNDVQLSQSGSSKFSFESILPCYRGFTPMWQVHIDLRSSQHNNFVAPQRGFKKRYDRSGDLIVCILSVNICW